MKEEKKVEFAKFRLAYTTVKNFLEQESRENIDSLKIKIVEDLKMAGDDNYFLLTKFVDTFELNHEGFNYDERFHSEAEFANPTIILFNLLSLSVWLPLKTIELLTFNNLRIKKPSFHKPKREVTDMTFRDLLIWYIEGNYTDSEKIKYII